MDEEEFNVFQNRLFATYPATLAWLQDNSPDAAETLRSWHRRLKKYSLSDCLEVLANWEERNSEPWKAYDRENVPAVIASVIAKKYSDQFRREQARQMVEESARARNGRREATGFDLTASFDSQMLAAFNELKPAWDSHCKGELSAADYEEKKDRVLSERLAVRGEPCVL